MRVPDPRRKPTLSIRETAALLNMGLNNTYEAARNGEIPAVRIGARWLVPTAKLLDMLGIDWSKQSPPRKRVRTVRS
ncbi:helix-turn-helix domain-containing protein [Micromonospora mirobrigensis]|uniref:helix-turn-helix domain-containing protein n=1 Tax=Micromonospora mirobrigensis TaxID=262898 RepID=UPI00114D107E